jgi:multiple sugar transport system substrate-binding protein
VTIPTRYRGLTWDHPRGAHALLEAARRLVATDAVCQLNWSRQPLADFEEHPLDALAARYDLLVIDHPHLGEAIAKDALQPLDALFDEATLAAWRAGSVGRSYASYELDGHLWALPIDAAAQVMATRADLCCDTEGERVLPDTWQDVLALARRKPVALSLAGPHAVLMFFSLCIALGENPIAHDPDILISTETGVAAYEWMRELASLCVFGGSDLSPIALLEALAARDDLVCCPLIYGYVNYAVPCQSGKHALTFTNAPAGANGIRGSVLGGTGLALSRRAKPSGALLDHLRWLMSEPCQRSFIPQFDGQPGARAAWQDDEVNRASGSFYANTLETLECAWVRPRYDSYIAFQRAASMVLRLALEAGTAASRVVADLQTIHLRYATCRAGH